MRDWVPIVVAACALAAALSNYRGTIRVSRANEAGNQLKWLQEARDDAAKARTEADRAKTEADETRDESAQTRREIMQTRRELIELRDLVDELTRWTLRVVAAKNDPDITLDDLRHIIDNGPPSLRAIPKGPEA